MLKRRDLPPTETRWDVMITNGVHPTVEGARGGWGWICRSHPRVDGYHGYADLSETLAGLTEHLQRCPGRG